MILFLDPVLGDGQGASRFDLVLHKKPYHHLKQWEIHLNMEVDAAK